MEFDLPELEIAPLASLQKRKRVRNRIADIECAYHVRADIPFNQVKRPGWKRSRQELWDLAVEEGNLNLIIFNQVMILILRSNGFG